MRLLTHNVLRSPMKGAQDGYPLRIEATDVQVGMPEGSLPPALTPELLEDSSFLQALHRVLMDMHVVEGALICPETGRRFPIAEGVPDLMCTESEVR
eukprot:jgi/Undpi1/11983/HiC_scaffold_4.g01682.m1